MRFNQDFILCRETCPPLYEKVQIPNIDTGYRYCILDYTFEKNDTGVIYQDKKKNTKPKTAIIFTPSKRSEIEYLHFLNYTHLGLHFTDIRDSKKKQHT